MEISVKELRTKPGQIIKQASRGVEIIVTLRGKKIARIVPLEPSREETEAIEDELFGLWKDRTDIHAVEAYVRDLRKERSF